MGRPDPRIYNPNQLLPSTSHAGGKNQGAAGSGTKPGFPSWLGFALGIRLARQEPFADVAETSPKPKPKLIESLAKCLYSPGKHDLAMLERADRLLKPFGELPAGELRSLFVEQIHEKARGGPDKLDFTLYLLLDVVGGIATSGKIPVNVRKELIASVSRMAGATDEESNYLLVEILEPALRLGEEYGVKCDVEKISRYLQKARSHIYVEQLIAAAADMEFATSFEGAAKSGEPDKAAISDFGLPKAEGAMQKKQEGLALASA